MRNKTQVNNLLEQLRNDVKNINYLARTGCTFEQLTDAFSKTYQRLDNLQNLIDVEPDEYKSNQIL